MVRTVVLRSVRQFGLPLSRWSLALLLAICAASAGVTRGLGRTPCAEAVLYSIPGKHTMAERITAGPDGALWFTTPYSIGRVTPTGEFADFPVPTGTRPRNIVAGSDAALWFTSSDGVGRITVNGSLRHFDLPDHALPGDGIAAGPDGAVWLPISLPNRRGVSVPNEAIGRIESDGAFTRFDLPSEETAPDRGLGDIVSGPDGALWFTERISNRIGRMTTSGQYTAFEISYAPPTFPPINTFRPQHLEVGADGALWFTSAQFITRVGRITVEGVLTGPFPSAGNHIGAIVRGLDDALWINSSEIHPDERGMLSLPGRSYRGRMLTDGTYEELTLPEGVRASRFAAGPDGAMWFTSTLDGLIGRLELNRECR
jgi:virginiamycin B lyase